MPMSRRVALAPKVNNASAMHSIKAELRRRVLNNLGAPARVFDAFAGDGEMYRAVWREAEAYEGCDFKLIRDRRVAFVGDNRRVLRAIDLQAFNVFDLDAYGSPWEQALIIAANRTVAAGQRIGFTISEGSALKLKLGGMPNALRIIAGVTGDPAGLARESERFLDAALEGLARRLKCETVQQWRATGKTGARMRYVGLILESKVTPREIPMEPPIQEPAPLPVANRVKRRRVPKATPMLDDPGV
jgi:hypothetical protein